MSLVNTNWLEQNINNVKIIDCSWHMPQANRNGYEEYAKEHMPNTIIFDLDGVLVDTKLIHFEALNLALKKFNINEIKYEDHIKVFDGLPTFKKLELISKKNQFSKSKFLKIQKIKQKYTIKLLKKNVKYNKKLYQLFEKLSKKYKLVVATNAVRSTLNICLRNLN